MWEKLDTPWKACLEEAWAAYPLGSLPIGAVVVNESGEIIGRGRNRTREASGYPLAGHRLAHAEINALLSTNFNKTAPNNCTLFASTEPCPLCIGALAMSNVPRIIYACRDPWAGATNLLASSEYMRMQNISSIGPQDSDLESILVAIQVSWHLQTGKDKARPIVDAWEENSPNGVALGRSLHKTRELANLAKDGFSISEVIERITI